MSRFTGALFWNDIRTKVRAGRRGNMSVDAKGLPPALAGFLVAKWEIVGGLPMSAAVRRGGRLPALLRQVVILGLGKGSSRR